MVSCDMQKFRFQPETSGMSMLHDRCTPTTSLCNQRNGVETINGSSVEDMSARPQDMGGYCRASMS